LKEIAAFGSESSGLPKEVVVKVMASGEMMGEKATQAGSAEDEVLAGESVADAVGACEFVCVQERQAGFKG